MRNRIPLLAVAVLALTGCRYKPLCYDHNHLVDVRVVYDWKDAPEAELEGMTVLFYDLSGKADEPIRYDLPGKEGGVVRLPHGDWQAVSYNYDSESILFRGLHSIGTVEAYTRSSSVAEGTKLMTRGEMPRESSSANQPVILEPEAFWGAASAPFQLQIYDPERTIVITPQPLYRQVYVTINNVPNLQYTNGLGGTLSGLAPSVFVADGQLADGCAVEAFSIMVADKTTLTAQFLIFGHCPYSEREVYTHNLTIYVIMSDGSKWYYTVDVTGQMHDRIKNPDGQPIYIDIDGLDVPKPIVNGSGFHPTVDDWKNEEIEVHM